MPLAPRRDRRRRLLRPRPTHPAHPGARLPGRGRRRGLPRRGGHRRRRLHARRLRQGRRRPRGARRRRDLGRDAVGPAPGAPGQDRQRGRRLRRRGDPRLRRPAGLTARAVDARHAQRDPDRGADRLRRRGPRPRVGRVPQARHGLLRRHGRRRGHAARSRTSLPPPDPNGPKGAVTGVVTDSDSGLPIEGVRVGFGGHASRPEFERLPRRRDRPDGRYTIENVPTGTYPKLAFFASAGYDPGVARNVADQPPTRRRPATSG